jgi:hypothetical protein
MAAELLLDQRYDLDEDAFAEVRIWRVPRPVPGSNHPLKYSLAYVVSGECVLRYDNEAGKGDHRHWKWLEEPYQFTTAETLIDDFWRDVEELRR